MDVRVGIVGAAGAVGAMVLRVLEERSFPLSHLRCLATARSAGARVRFRGTEVPVEETTPASLRGMDICFLAVPGAQTSRELAPLARDGGAFVIDKGSAFRLDPDVPLVVPEVNGEQVCAGQPGLVASPNCTTIPLVLCLHPLGRRAGLRRVIVSTYQAASGAGRAGAEALRREAAAVLAGREAEPSVFPRRLAFNVIPQCDRFGEAGYTGEEWKLMRESRKILGRPDLRIAATAARVPVFVGHSESVYVETEEPLSVAEARALLRAAPGVCLQDDPEAGAYATAAAAEGSDLAHVSRLRQDPEDGRGLHLWVVGDNLRRGAATNAVQIAELWLSR
jgi:aspartate-semialdehyde dehydrogenase